MQHEVTVFVRNKPHQVILDNWNRLFPGTSMRRYWGGCEKGFDVSINIDHFVHALPLASKANLEFIFFPQIDTPPPEGVRLLAVSNFARDHIKFKWNRDADTFYIPIKGIYKPLRKQKAILHVSRFTEPSEWADKAHRQMIQVFKMYRNDLADWTLVFAGALDPGQEDYFNELTLLARGHEIQFMMNPNDRELATLYGRASVYWHATGISI